MKSDFLKPEQVRGHFENLSRLLRLERDSEIEEFKASFQQKSPEEREAAGLSLLRMRIQEFHYAAGGHRLVTFVYDAPRPIVLQAPEPGDMVSVVPSGQLAGKSLFGTVYEREPDSLTVAFRSSLEEEDLPDVDLFDLHRAGGGGSFDKMDEALRKVRDARDSRLAFFRDLSFGLREPESYDPLNIEKIEFLDPDLNTFQKEALAKAHAAKDIFVLHGPPGTGKTRVLIELIRQTIREGKCVWATAPSNTACDHLVERLAARGVKVLRLGHPARIMNHLRKFTLDHQVAFHPLTQEMRKLERDLDQLYKRSDRRKDRREMDWEERQNFRQEKRDLREQISRLADEAWDQVVSSAEVVVSTLAGAGDIVLKSRTVDLAVVDEATQATEPICWNPFLKSSKVVLAGDHFQLPPTVKCIEAERGGLGRTLFERFHQALADEWKSLLRIQYRMHEKIMTFSSNQFYGGALQAHESVKHHVLAELDGVQDDPETQTAVTFLDTAGAGFDEKPEFGTGSRSNPEEAELLITKVEEILKLGVDPNQIAVISPYGGQVRYLMSRLRQTGVEIDTVDGFQGREKEAVFISLVRSNPKGEIGFLGDTRRMNVALTRARRKLWVVGDSATLTQFDFYKSFLDYVHSIGAWKSTWE